MKLPDVAGFASFYPLPALIPPRKGSGRGWLRSGLGPEAPLSHNLWNKKIKVLFLSAFCHKPILYPEWTVPSSGYWVQLIAFGQCSGLPQAQPGASQILYSVHLSIHPSI